MLSEVFFCKLDLIFFSSDKQWEQQKVLLSFFMELEIFVPSVTILRINQRTRIQDMGSVLCEYFMDHVLSLKTKGGEPLNHVIMSIPSYKLNFSLSFLAFMSRPWRFLIISAKNPSNYSMFGIYRTLRMSEAHRKTFSSHLWKTIYFFDMIC